MYVNKINTISKEDLIISLRVVKDKALSNSLGDYVCMGICGNWQEELGDCFSYILVRELSKDWFHYSGDPDLPIGDDYFKKNLWVGKSLELRLGLIDHILTKLNGMSQEDIDVLYQEYIDCDY